MIIAGSVHGNLSIYFHVDQPLTRQMNLPYVENNTE
jgi:hypothetical protein